MTADGVERAAITGVYVDAFAREEGVAPDDVRKYVQDGALVGDEQREEIRKLAERYTEISIEVREVGMVDDDSAVVVFQLPGALSWTFGDAELVDGRWLVGSQTFCHLIGSSSIACPSSMWDDSLGSSRYAH